MLFTFVLVTYFLLTNADNKNLTTELKTCPPGSWLSGGSCKLCNAGTFNPFSGGVDDSVCRLCLANTFQPNAGSTGCNPCPPRTISPRGSRRCLKCGAGTEVDFQRDRCILCRSGTFNSKRLSPQCEKCPFPLGSPKGSTSIAQCRGCPPGQYFDGFCRECSGGTFKSGREGLCEDCPSGQTSRNGASKCVHCPENTFPVFGKKGNQFKHYCAACLKGKVSAKGSGICHKPGKPCPPRYYEARNGACQTCKTGFAYNPKKRICQRCPEGFVSRGGLQTECTKCPKGQMPDVQNQVCHCREGFYFDDDNSCVVCPPGHWSSVSASFPRSELGRKSCAPCPRGTFSGKPGKPCQKCPFPLVAPEKGCTICRPCAPETTPDFKIWLESVRCVTLKNGCGLAEKISYIWGFCESKLCAVDTPKGEIGVKCSSCEPGAFLKSTKTGLRFCVKCPFDEFSITGLESSCLKCPKGKVRSKLDGSKCTCNGKGRKESETIGGRWLQDGLCKKCPAGTFSFSNLYFPGEEDVCTPCRPGTFAANPGTKECEECPLNTFSSAPGARKCQTCPRDTIGYPHFGAVKCIPRPKGF